VARKKILIVEDEGDISDFLSEALQRSGYAVLIADNGIGALQIADSEPIELIITDIVMPKMNGFVFIEQLNKKSIDVPIIAVSGAYGDRLKHLATTMNLFAAFEKPFSVKDLLEKVDEAIGKKKAS
tara:strand:+ start:746 stop:1123 length:378 start_codon:yes stop_codon:yes gene_type:complete